MPAWLRCVCLTVPAVFFLPGTQASADVDFAADVKPIFEQHCVSCHSSSISKGDFSLETAAEVAGSGYVTAGDVASSHLVDLIKPQEGQPPRMPDEGDPLTDDEVATIEDWIAAGANWPEGVRVVEKSKADATWWSLQPLKEFEQPRTIDSFIEAKLTEAGLAMNEPADRRTLIRRATYDLIGLPPTPEEVAAFANDESPDAYEQLIDRLLASPHYGERWGRHWLDVVRFGESNGFERNVIINNIWPFRDYVIRSINNDKPFDQFIREHLAGDVIGNGDPDTAVASAFLVAGPYDDVGNQDPVQAAQIRANTLDEIISATGQAFLGLTVGCARCHNHKFDPITQADYYAMYATFSGVRHGAVPLATSDAMKERNARLAPLNTKKAALEKSQRALRKTVLDRAKSKLADYESNWTREPIDRTRTEEKFDPVIAKLVRLTCDGRDDNPAALTGWHVDEFEIWSSSSTPSNNGAPAVPAVPSDVQPPPVNVALSSNGAKASGAARKIEDFPGAYGPHLAIDGKTGARFIAAGRDLTIELAKPTSIDRIVFSSAKGETVSDHRKFTFLAEYRIDVSTDGQTWTTIANGTSRKPVSDRHRDHRLFESEITADERAQLAQLGKDIGAINADIAKVPGLPSVFIGTRNPNDAKGPFHVFTGGSPQRKGDAVVPASLTSLEPTASAYELSADAPEADRRKALAEWIASDSNALTARVLANRVWHYHFGTGIVNTPSDFGYMGGRPSHPGTARLARPATDRRRLEAQVTPQNDHAVKGLPTNLDLQRRGRQGRWRLATALAIPATTALSRRNSRHDSVHHRQARHTARRPRLPPLPVHAGQRLHVRSARKTRPRIVPPSCVPPERPSLRRRLDDRLRPTRLRLLNTPPSRNHNAAPSSDNDEPFVHVRHGRGVGGQSPNRNRRQHRHPNPTPLRPLLRTRPHNKRTNHLPRLPLAKRSERPLPSPPELQRTHLCLVTYLSAHL